MQNSAKFLIKNAIVTGAGATVITYGDSRVIQVDGATTAGAGAATVLVQARASEDAGWVTLHTFTLVLSSTLASSAHFSEQPWPLIRLNVTAISGTGASISGWVAGEA